MQHFTSGSECYLLCSTGRIMPGIVEGYDSRGLCAVKAPGGRVYTCNPDNVLDVQAGRIMLMHARAEKMAAEGYQIAVRLNGSFRVFSPAKHGASGGYIVTRANDCLCCNCPSAAKEATCKHVMAVCSLLHKRAARLREAGKVRVATRYENLSAVIHQAA